MYMSQMKDMYYLHNSSGGVHPLCLSMYPYSQQWNCIFAAKTYQFIRIPFFLSNSLFDSWQLRCILSASPLLTPLLVSNNCSSVPGWTGCLATLALLPNTASNSPEFSPSIRSCSAAQKRHLSRYSNEMKHLIVSSPTWNREGNGGFLHTCYTHCAESNARWNSLQIRNISLRESVESFYFERNSSSLRLVGCTEAERPSPHCRSSCPSS